MTKAERELHQKKMAKLMRKMGGRNTLGWYKIRLATHRKVQISLFRVKRGKYIKQHQQYRARHLSLSIDKALAEIKK